MRKKKKDYQKVPTEEGEYKHCTSGVLGDNHGQDGAPLPHIHSTTLLEMMQQ